MAEKRTDADHQATIHFPAQTLVPMVKYTQQEGPMQAAMAITNDDGLSKEQRLTMLDLLLTGFTIIVHPDGGCELRR